jgi:membrane protein DedA with SNARE-associated domain/rhodanese-related sulfurtransferase
MMASLIVENAERVLCIWIMANQGGLPVPVVPALFGVGALVASGRLSIVTTMSVAVVATLCADLVWDGLGRWRGTRALALIARFLPTARGSVQRGQSLFHDHEGAFRLGARFLPELGPIAAGLAGVAGEGIPRFLLYGAISAALWAGTWVGLEYLVGQAVAEAAFHLGLRVMLIVVISLLLYVPLRRARRHRILRILRRSGMRPDELRARLEEGQPITILDVRSREDVTAAPYTLPGARWIRPDELSRRCREIPRTAEVVVYGGGSRQARTARAALYAHAALHLRRAGVRGVRPSAGGLHGWRRRGYPVHPLTQG